MKVSLITPAYQSAWCLGDMIGSVSKQTMLPEEILIGVDNCPSTLARAKELMKEYAGLNIRVFMFPTHVGCYRIRNTLATLASGDYISLFDADDIMDPCHIKKMHELAKDGFLTKGMRKTAENGKIIHAGRTADGVICVLKTRFLELNGYEPWECAADTEFNQRAQQKGIRVVAPKLPTFTVRKHANSLTRHANTNIKSRIREEYRREIVRREKTPVFPDQVAVSAFEEIKARPVILKEEPVAQEEEATSKQYPTGIVCGSLETGDDSEIASVSEPETTIVAEPPKPAPLLSVVVCSVRMDDAQIRKWEQWNAPFIYREGVVVHLVTDLPPMFDPSVFHVVHPPFMKTYSPAKASNRGIRTAVDEGCLAVLKTDVDCILSEELVRKAMTFSGSRAVCPVCRFVLSPDKLEGTDRPGPCGTFATSSRIWKKVGGYCETMDGYGFEDGDLLRRAKRIGVAVERETGLLRHVEHPSRVGRWYPLRRRENRKEGLKWKDPNWGKG